MDICIYSVWSVTLMSMLFAIYIMIYNNYIYIYISYNTAVKITTIVNEMSIYGCCK